MVDYKYYDENRNLLQTYSTDGMNLHKVGTQEVYSGKVEDGPIDLIDNIAEDGKPRSRFIYEECKSEI